MFKTIYHNDNGERFWDIPFSILNNDYPLEVEKYIKYNVVESSRRGMLSTWAKNIIVSHAKNSRRENNVGITAIRRCQHKDVIKGKLSRNGRNRLQSKEKYGIPIPRSTTEALIYDKARNNNLWESAMYKEISALYEMICFEFHPPSTYFKKEYGWQYTLLCMIYEIKQQNIRYKSRLVLGGHVVNADQYTTYSSTVQVVSIRIMMTIEVQVNLNLMSGDISNAFLSAESTEKVWSRAGKEFKHRVGSIVVINKALYGMKTAARSFHELLEDTLRHMGFTPSIYDQDLWWRKETDYDGYDFIVTHVDNILIASHKPEKYMSKIKKQFTVRNIQDNPSYYLGVHIKKRKGLIHLSCGDYISEILRRYQDKYGVIPKQNKPISPKIHPELYYSEKLDIIGTRKFQNIIGVCQWIVTMGNFDIQYAVESLR